MAKRDGCADDSAAIWRPSADTIEMKTADASLDFDDLCELVCSYLASACNVERSEVRLDTKMLDLNMDSLTFVAVLAQVEAVYQIQMTPESILELLTASSIRDLVAQLRDTIMATLAFDQADNGSAPQAP